MHLWSTILPPVIQSKFFFCINCHSQGHNITDHGILGGIHYWSMHVVYYNSTYSSYVKVNFDNGQDQKQIAKTKTRHVFD